MNKLEQLKEYSVVVGDTGNIDEIKKHRPQDATTNPSLLLQAISLPQYDYIFQEVVADVKNCNLSSEKKAKLAVTKLIVLLGKQILAIIPGYLSTEVDARLSFDTKKTIAEAKLIIEEYEKNSISRDRILIKIAGTWEGIRAAEILKKDGIKTNITLLFHIAQAVAAAQAGIFLISPFVGRILDWYKKNQAKEYTSQNDPGVISVKNIYKYYKYHQHKTIIMAASFRSQEQIEALAGCDRLTISPFFLSSLKQDEAKLVRGLNSDNIKNPQIYENTISESNFRLAMNDSPMATEKLAEGIRIFTKDQASIEQLFLNSFAN
ncbi:MAG: transaldolase [SAR324 cluster bacterium]|nr:transaldolase [SAR324 cluster bacterium]